MNVSHFIIVFFFVVCKSISNITYIHKSQASKFCLIYAFRLHVPAFRFLNFSLFFFKKRVREKQHKNVFFFSLFLLCERWQNIFKLFLCVFSLNIFPLWYFRMKVAQTFRQQVFLKIYYKINSLKLLKIKIIILNCV